MKVFESRITVTRDQLQFIAFENVNMSASILDEALPLQVAGGRDDRNPFGAQ